MATVLDYSQFPPQSRGVTQAVSSRPSTNSSSRPFGHAATQQLSDKENYGSAVGPKKAIAMPSGNHYLNPHHKTGSHPTLGSAISRSGSEADSLIDLYGHPRSQASTSVEKHDGAVHVQDSNLEEEDPEQSRWIHRDKLAIIESKELREAGIQVPVPARTTSKAKRRRQQSSDRDNQRERTSLTAKGEEAPAATLPIASEEYQATEEQDGGLFEFDIRTPEEIAADSYTSPSMYRQQPSLRASSSRIPIARSAPVPLPQEPLERSTPLPRTRTASGSWPDEDGIAYPKSRSRSQSFGSPVLLDDMDPTIYHTSSHSRQPSGNHAPLSPSKVRTPSNRPTTSSNAHARKTSGTNGSRNFTSPDQGKNVTATPAKPTPIRSMSAQRPKSRSGLEPRPPTGINRPEGEPPWIATMYKPDPRLPPDQQLLPTHAKRLQQEEAMRASKHQRSDSGSYKDSSNDNDQNIAGHGSGPLAVHTKDGLQRNSLTSPRPSQSPNHELDSPASQGGAWPLKPLTSPLVPNTRALNLSTSSNPSPVSPMSMEGDGGNGRLNSISGASHGGYSTMPKVTNHGNGSVVGLSSPIIGGGRDRSPLPKQMERKEKMERPGVVDDGKESKTCGCCVVM